MKKVQKKYEIEVGDTTSAIADKLGLSVAELVYYHNLHSGVVDEYIYGDILPQKLKYILLPISYEQEIPIPPKVEYSSANVTKATGKTMKKYGITERYFQHEKMINELDFEIDIMEEIHDDLYVATFNKHSVRINNSDSFRLAEQLYYKIDQCIYPLKLSSNHDGSFKSVVNSKEIKERWIRQRPELEEYYQGETGAEILSKAEEALCNAELYGNRLLNSIFFKLWHTPVYRSYAYGKTVEYEDHYLIFPQHTGIKFKVSLNSDLKINENNKFIIRLTGSCIDSRSENELWNAPSNALVNRNPEHTVKGDIRMVFKIDETDKRIFSVAGFIELQGKNHHKRIEIGIYEL
ncbi:hypothetical protein BBH99_17320 [Chryseobacterium contaminans]|uniref:LysM domain-containing protein n=1 Tax=Chryseobacterium contaminans TaxID=1423959 RepID=A0A1M6XWQ1_9FLAO|nr:hypothetical protein [Chryseobacterium contaminans]OCA79927.1 hypothetical protein BBH99_17320 [Chryseobacterium contaminans]SHL10420.1 hypothetical protein SAMN05444407_102253 [Chryseobacterium contaminans]